MSELGRRGFIETAGAAAAAALDLDAAAEPEAGGKGAGVRAQPNILFVMTDQQRFDTIAALGNRHIYTPNLDRLVRRGLAFTNAYSPCPVCVPARYTIRTGRNSPTIRCFTNGRLKPATGQQETMEGRCGPYLPRTLRDRGYRTFGVGKFHTSPRFEDLGYDVHLHSEELYGSVESRERDAFASWIAKQHPAYDFVEGLMGERTEMYYMPQMSTMPAEATVESWAADRAIEQIGMRDARPYFGFVSFVGPHPPFAPPIPFNRIYDPDRMPNPIRGDVAVDHMDEQIPRMNYAIWADDISDARARALKARYSGEITYIDDCLGRILDAVDARPDGDNTLICFFADHGDHLGDHHAWQKESFFDASCRIPFLVSWPAALPRNVRRSELVCLTDLFAIATHAAGQPETRDGIDVLSVLDGSAEPREYIVGYYGNPGTDRFKIMIRDEVWKYIFLANAGREQLFNLADDPDESRNLAAAHSGVARKQRRRAVEACRHPGAGDALEGEDLRVLPYRRWKSRRIYQFDASRGVRGFPEDPGDVIRKWNQQG